MLSKLENGMVECCLTPLSSNHCQLFRQWLCGKAASGLERILCGVLVNPFPNKPRFLRACSTSVLKTLWEKEKLLVMSNFSFSHCVFLSVWRTFCQFHQIQNFHLQTLSVRKRPKSVVRGRVKKELQESRDRCTGRRHILVTEILLKTALNTIHSINLYHFQHDFSHIKVKVHIFMYFLGFTRTRLRL